MRKRYRSILEKWDSDVFCRQNLLKLRHNNKNNMLISADDQILIKINKARRGTLFFIDDFASIGNKKTVGKALERLVNSGELHRVATGIYVRPEKDRVLGVVLPRN